MRRGAAAIVGAGESRIGKHPDSTSLGLMAEAATDALAQAGLGFDDIDGLITTPTRIDGWMMPCTVVASALGIQPDFFTTVDIAGASGTAMVHQAAMAVASGACHTVLCVAGQNLLSGLSRDGDSPFQI